jgi:hypothetical protein
MPKRRINDSPAAPSVRKAADLGIEREIAEAARRVRWQDGLAGLAGIAVLVLGYAAVMVVLDRWLVLPQWVRQIAFAGFLTILGTVAYFFIVRPLQRSVNPRYIARQLENTQSETKNEIINWVDMRGKEIPASIRESLDAKAAEGLAQADVNTAIRSGKVAWLGGAAMVLVGVLAVLFLVFKAGQFTSLLGRAFNPFQSTAIGTRTKIELLEPQPADLTITDGEQLRLVVKIDGKKPSADGPDRVRLKLRQSQNDPLPEEFPFTTGANRGEYELVLGRSAIRNGFWYTVAAGDAETAEHRVDVRTRPLILAFQVRYEYPAYTRMVPDVGREPRIEAHRGTTVTLTVKTNRQLKSGSISFDGKPAPLAGEVVADAKDLLRFRFKLEESTNYRVQFTSTENEASGSSPPYPIDVILDRPPTVLIESPNADEIPLPVNGLLAVDGTITDDFGLETAALVVKVPQADGSGIELRKKYLGGESLKRTKDGIHPASLNYKDSVRLDSLKNDAGKPVALQPDMVLEYWIEATDNCTEPKANVGKSAVQRVKLLPPPAKPEQTKEQEQKAGERQANEKAQQQGEKTKRENTKPQKPQQRPDRQPEKKDEAGANEQPEQNPMGEPMGEKPMGEPMGEQNPKNPGNGNDQPNPDEVKRKAEELQNKIDQQNKEAADTKPNPNEADPMMGEEKPGEGKAGGSKPEAQQPLDPKQGDPKEGAADSKEGGKVQQPENATEKPKPEEGTTGNDKERPEPRGGQAAGEEKPGEKPNEKYEGKAGEGKAEQPKPEEGKEPNTNDPPKAGKAKNDGQAKPSEEKPSEGMGGEKEQPGEAKGDKPEKSGSKKGGPKEPPMGDKPGEEKPQAGNEATEGSNEKGMGQEKAPPMGNGDPKGSQKESKPQPGNGGGEQQPSKEEIAQAEKDLKDLTSKDEKTRKDAEKRLDDQIGKEKREEVQRKAEQLEKESQSEDKEMRDAAQGELQRLANESAKNKKNPTRDPRKGDADQLNRDAEDLSSDDPKKRQDAEQRLDDQIGKENRDELQKKSKETKKDRESGDPDKKAKAEQDLKNQADKAAKAGKNGQGKPDQTANKEPTKEPTKEELDQFKKDAQDLNSPDEKTRKEAEKRIDDKIGKENREAAQKKAKELENDLKSGDPEKKAKAEKELEDLAKKAQGGKPDQTAKNEPTKEQMDQFKKDVQDLNSPDEKTRKDAEKRIEDKIGKENREKAQAKAKQLEEDLKSPDKDTRAKAEQELKDLAKKAGGGKPDETAQKNPTPEQIEQMKEDAQDLASKDDQKRKDAEKKLDEQIGKEKRQELQKDMQDLASGDPNKVEEAKKRIEEKLKEEAKKRETAGNGGKGPDGKPIDDNKENRVKTAERQLEQFKKYRGDKKFLKENNMTEAEYEKFLRGYEDMLAKEKQQVENEKLNPPSAQPNLPTTVGSNDGSGGRVEKTPSGTAVEGPGGSGVAPPGYNEAQGGFTIPRRPKK